MEGGREEQSVITCHRTVWVGEAALSCPGPVSPAGAEPKARIKGPWNQSTFIHSFLTNPALLVHQVSVHWEWSRAFHGGKLRPEQKGSWAGEATVSEKEGSESLSEGCRK